MKIKCPFCQVVLQLENPQPGATLNCPECDNLLKLPDTVPQHTVQLSPADMEEQPAAEEEMEEIVEEEAPARPRAGTGRRRGGRAGGARGRARGTGRRARTGGTGVRRRGAAGGARRGRGAAAGGEEEEGGRFAPPEKKNNTPLIIGIIAGVVVLLVVVFVMMDKSDRKPLPEDNGGTMAEGGNEGGGGGEDDGEAGGGAVDLNLNDPVAEKPEPAAGGSAEPAAGGEAEAGGKEEEEDKNPEIPEFAKDWGKEPTTTSTGFETGCWLSTLEDDVIAEWRTILKPEVGPEMTRMLQSAGSGDAGTAYSLMMEDKPKYLPWIIEMMYRDDEVIVMEASKALIEVMADLGVTTESGSDLVTLSHMQKREYRGVQYDTWVRWYLKNKDVVSGGGGGGGGGGGVEIVDLEPFLPAIRQGGQARDDAINQFRNWTPGVYRALIRLFDTEGDLGLIRGANKCLKQMTGQDFGSVNVSNAKELKGKWEEWLKSN